MHPSRFALLSAVLLTGSGAALAQPATPPAPDTARLEAQEAKAKQACDGGRVPEGVRLLTELLKQTKDGTYIFNLGRCYQQNGQLDQALVHFRAYLRRPDVDPTAAARAREYVAVLERSPARAMTPAPATPPPQVDPAPAAAGSPTLVASGQPAPGSSGRGLRIGGLAAGGAGLVSLATGVYYGLQTRKLNRETDRAADAGKPAGWYEEQNKQGERAERRQWLFLGAGATAVAAGGVLYYLGTRAGELPRATLVPVAMPRGDGAMLMSNGRF